MMAEWNEDDPLARISGESKKANSALADYWGLGAQRTLVRLHHVYTEVAPETRKTRYLRTLKEWLRKHHWQARIARQQQIVNEQLEAFRQT